MGERKYERAKMVLPIRIGGQDANGQPFSLLAHTLDFSRMGARIGGVRVPLRPGDEITVEYKRQRGRFVVRWVGTKYDIGVESLAPDKFQFMDLPERSYHDDVKVDQLRERGAPPESPPAVAPAAPATPKPAEPAAAPAEQKLPAQAPPAVVSLTPQAAVMADLKRLLRDNNGDTDNMLQLVASRVRELLPAAGAAVAVLQGEDWICRASSGVAPRIGVRFQSPQGLTREAASSGRVVICRDTEQDPRVNPFIWRSVQLRSAASAPILRDRSAIGVLEVFADQPNAFADEHGPLLSELAGMLATVVTAHSATQH